MPRKAVIGERSIDDAGHSGHSPSDRRGTSRGFGRVFREGVASINVALSKLVVVDSFLLGSGLCEIARNEMVQTNYMQMSWSSGILDHMEKGRLDLAIYNEKLTQRHIEGNSGSKIHIVKRVNHSMGGRCFSIVATRRSRMSMDSCPDLQGKLAGRNVYVGLASDRFENLCMVLGMTREQASGSGINFVDISDPSTLDILRTDPDGVIVGGQNIRFLAYQNDDFDEVINFDSLTDDHKKEMMKSSANCLVVSDCFKEKIQRTTEEIFDMMISHFNRHYVDGAMYDSLVDNLAVRCEFPGDLLMHHSIVKHILFETYRMGEPQW